MSATVVEVWVIMTYGAVAEPAFLGIFSAILRDVGSIVLRLLVLDAPRSLSVVYDGLLIKQ
jgi:hypothetical protein